MRAAWTWWAIEIVGQHSNEALTEVTGVNRGIVEVVVRLTRSGWNDFGHVIMSAPLGSPTCLYPAIQIPHDVGGGVVHA